MSLHCRKSCLVARVGQAALLAFALTLASPVRAATEAAPRVLHVAADPNNLPFSDAQGGGFENKLVALIAADLGMEVAYTWHAQRRGFFRETVKEGPADVVAGVPRGFERLLTTRPYYRSGYMMVVRKRRQLRLTSLDDPALRPLSIGVQLIGDDGANTPPAHALTRRGLIENIRGFTVYGDYRERAPPARIVDAVARGEIDVGLVWGPVAGYFARDFIGEAALELQPLGERDELSGQPLSFEICVGVRKGARELRDAVDSILARRQVEIGHLLAEYGVPQLPGVREEKAP